MLVCTGRFVCYYVCMKKERRKKLDLNHKYTVGFNRVVVVVEQMHLFSVDTRRRHVSMGVRYKLYTCILLFKRIKFEQVFVLHSLTCAYDTLADDEKTKARIYSCCVYRIVKL